MFIINDTQLKQIYDIMVRSYPQIELRSEEEQSEVAKLNEFEIRTIEEEGVICGFLTAWHLESCIFIEHIAIDPAYRGRKYGRRLLEELMDDVSSKPFIVSVSPSDDPVALKRVEFYRKSGFHLCFFDYYMPPMQPQFFPVEMLLMSFPSELKLRDFSEMKKEIFHKVYNQD